MYPPELAETVMRSVPQPRQQRLEASTRLNCTRNLPRNAPEGHGGGGPTRMRGRQALRRNVDAAISACANAFSSLRECLTVCGPAGAPPMLHIQTIFLKLCKMFYV